MKSSVFLACFVVIAYAAQPPTADETKKDLRKAYDKCRKQVGVDTDFVLQSLDGNKTDFQKKTAYYLCVSLVMGSVDYQGKLQNEYIEQALGEIIKDPELKKVGLSKCALQKPTAEETVLHMVPCFIQFLMEHGAFSTADKA